MEMISLITVVQSMHFQNPSKPSTGFAVFHFQQTKVLFLWKQSRASHIADVLVQWDSHSDNSFYDAPLEFLFQTQMSAFR